MYTEVKALLLFAINASQTALIAVCSFNICRTNLLKGQLQHNSFQTETVGGEIQHIKDLSNMIFMVLRYSFIFYLNIFNDGDHRTDFVKDVGWRLSEAGGFRT